MQCHSASYGYYSQLLTLLGAEAPRHKRFAWNLSQEISVQSQPGQSEHKEIVSLITGTIIHQPSSEEIGLDNCQLALELCPQQSLVQSKHSINKC